MPRTMVGLKQNSNDNCQTRISGDLQFPSLRGSSCCGGNCAFQSCCEDAWVMRHVSYQPWFIYAYAIFLICGFLLLYLCMKLCSMSVLMPPESLFLAQELDCTSNHSPNQEIMAVEEGDCAIHC